MNKLQKYSKLIATCQELIRINTENPPGNENALVDYCKDKLSDLGAEIEIIRHSANRSSLIAKWEGPNKGKQILIACHADTVPVGRRESWQRDPFSAEVNEDRIIGRGASDMKSGIAVVLSALKVIKSKKTKNTIVFVLTADEECDGIGVISILDPRYGISPDFVMVPEPTENNIAIAEKGTLWVELQVRGTSGHAATPNIGENAIQKMTKLVMGFQFSNFETAYHSLLGNFSSCITTIQGGEKINIIPDLCKSTFDMRILPGQSIDAIMTSIEKQANAILGKNDFQNLKIKALLKRNPIESKRESIYVNKVIEIVTQIKKDVKIIGVPYFSDAAILVSHYNVPFVICGPGSIIKMHADEEYVEIQNMIDSYKIYRSLLESFL